MASLIETISRRIRGPKPKIVCEAGVWHAGVAELRRRAGGWRESGAWLLGSMKKVRVIEEFVFYDDIDPDALKTGFIMINGLVLGDLWEHCRKTRRAVVADVHVHPGGFGQSQLDMDNPIMTEAGHIAIVLPYYAARSTGPDGIGVYEHLGARRWQNYSHVRPTALHIGWWPWS